MMIQVGMTKGLSHVTIAVSDIERAKNFYRSLLGWDELFSSKLSGPEFEALTGITGAAGEVAGGAVGDNRLELVCMNFVGQPAVKGLGLSRIAFEVDDVAKAWLDAAAAGAVVMIEHREIVGCRMITVSDPDGMMIELIEYVPGGGAWGGTDGRPQLRS
jgi:catechol 2,3-dioxygenase-like lactoylglutathione lyase family enzyme